MGKWGKPLTVKRLLVMEKHIIPLNGRRNENRAEEEAELEFLQGREEGFEAIFHRYYPPLCYLAQGLLGSRPAAEDIVSESFARLWERRERLSSRGSLRAWLYTTVHNACIDTLRREKLRSIHQAYTKRAGEEGVRPAEHRIIEAETLHRLYTAMETLPPRCGRVLRLYYLEEKSLQEIATDMNVSINTVKTQKGRAVELLRKRVGGR